MTVGAAPSADEARNSPSASGWRSQSRSSASPPARRTKSQTHSPAWRTSPSCAESALTLGMRTNSVSSSSQAFSTARESTAARVVSARLRGDVLQRLRLCKRAELLQALVLDLADPLACHVERPPHLVERPRVLAVQPVPQLEDAALARREAAEHALQRRFPQLHLGDLVRKRLVLVGEEVAELGLLVVSDRLLERDRRLRAAPDRLDLGGVELELIADLPCEGLAPQLGPQLALSARDLVQLLDDVHRHPDRAGLVRERARDGLADPPCRVGRELEPFAMVELLGGADEADRPFLDQVEEGQALVAVLLRDRDDEPQIRLDHFLLGAVVAALDPLGELDFLCGGQQVDLADVLEEQLQRVGRDLAHLGLRLGGRFLRLRAGLEHLDLHLLQGVVEVVDLRRLELQLVECQRDLCGVQRAVLARGLEQALCLLGLEQLGDCRRLCLFALCAQGSPPRKSL